MLLHSKLYTNLHDHSNLIDFYYSVLVGGKRFFSYFLPPRLRVGRPPLKLPATACSRCFDRNGRLLRRRRGGSEGKPCHRRAFQVPTLYVCVTLAMTLVCQLFSLRAGGGVCAACGPHCVHRWTRARWFAELRAGRGSRYALATPWLRRLLRSRPRAGGRGWLALAAAAPWFPVRCPPWLRQQIGARRRLRVCRIGVTFQYRECTSPRPRCAVPCRGAASDNANAALLPLPPRWSHIDSHVLRVRTPERRGVGHACACEQRSVGVAYPPGVRCDRRPRPRLRSSVET